MRLDRGDAHPGVHDRPGRGAAGREPGRVLGNAGRRRGAGYSGPARRDRRGRRRDGFRGRRVRAGRGAGPPVSAEAAGGGRARCAGPGVGPGGPPRHRHPARRRARRARVRDRPRHRRLRPADAGGGRPGDREDRGVDPLRRGEHLRRRAGVGLGAPGRVGGERDAARHPPAPRERLVLGRVRHLQRPAQRGRLLHQPARGDRRLRHHQRGQSERRLEPGVGRAHRPVRGRLDGGDGDPVQVPALPPGAAPAVGGADSPSRPPEERANLHHLGAHRGRPPGHLPHVRRRPPRGPRRAGQRHQPRDQAVRHLRGHHRPHAGHAAPERRRRRLRGRRQVRHHPEPDRGLHLEHRLRPGRGGRAAGEPDPVQPVLPREARVLPRGPRHLRVRPGGRPQPPRRRPAADRHRPVQRGEPRAHAVLLAPHRAPGRCRGAHHRRGESHRQGGRLRRRGAEHACGRRADRRRRADQLHRRPDQARHPAPQRPRGPLHQPLGVARRRRGQPDPRRRRHLLVLRERQRRRLPGPDADAGPHRPRPELPGAGQLGRRPLRVPGRAPDGRGQLPARGRVLAARELPPLVRGRAVQPPARLDRGDPPVPPRGQLRLRRSRRHRRRRDPAGAARVPDRVREQRPHRRVGGRQLRVPRRAVRAGAGRGAACRRLPLPRLRDHVHPRGAAPPERRLHAQDRRVLRRHHPVRRLPARPARPRASARGRADGVRQLDRDAAGRVPRRSARLAHHLDPLAAHVLQRPRPVQLEHPHRQQQPPAAVGVQPRQRAVRRLHRGSGQRSAAGRTGTRGGCATAGWW